jgi:ribosomal protein S18 acetylase RimI-like enzyme
MTEAEYQAYVARGVREYAEQHVRSGRWTADEALEKAAEEHRNLLPQGLATPNQHLFSIEDDVLGAKVGMLWFAIQERNTGRTGYIYDIEIDEQFRRRGYAEQAFHAFEALAGEMGVKKISLHVFGHNHAARSLYQKLGYVETNVMMSKSIHE